MRNNPCSLPIPWTLMPQCRPSLRYLFALRPSWFRVGPDLYMFSSLEANPSRPDIMNDLRLHRPRHSLLQRSRGSSCQLSQKLRRRTVDPRLGLPRHVQQPVSITSSITVGRSLAVMLTRWGLTKRRMWPPCLTSIRQLGRPIGARSGNTQSPKGTLGTLVGN